MPCIHGLDEASWCDYCKKRKIQKKYKKPNAKKRVGNSQTNALKSACKVCRVRPPLLGARGKCKTCAIKAGYKVCVNCKKTFLPKSSGVRFCGCRKTKKRKGSVWIVASAGLPSLGKRS